MKIRWTRRDLFVCETSFLKKLGKMDIFRNENSSIFHQFFQFFREWIYTHENVTSGPSYENTYGSATIRVSISSHWGWKILVFKKQYLCHYCDWGNMAPKLLWGPCVCVALLVDLEDGFGCLLTKLPYYRPPEPHVRPHPQARPRQALPRQLQWSRPPYRAQLNTKMEVGWCKRPYAVVISPP